MLKKWSIVFIIFTFFSQIGFGAVSAKLVFILGTVQYKTSIQDKEWRPVYANMVLNESASLRTGKGALAYLTISDSIKIKISGMTTIEMKKLAEEKTLQLYTGKIWSKVEKSNAKRLFSVRSPSTVVGVRGTEFIFETTDLEDKLYVEEGKVVFGKGADEKNASLVKKGEIAVLKKDKKEAEEQKIEVKIASFEDIKNLKGEFDIKKIKKIPFVDSSANDFLDFK